jgi:AcrR family transcriptional regulator
MTERRAWAMDRRVARTKKNIYYAFFQLVQTKAIDEITVSELARTADIDRKTFYLHYQTVQDVFVEFK